MNIAGTLPHRGGSGLLRAAVGLVTFLTFVASIASSAVADSRLSFQAQPGSTVRITGRATLGTWECETRDIVAVIEPGAALEALSASLTGLAARRPSCGSGAETPYANITIPVTSLRSNKPGMRADLLRALKHEESPLIVFTLRAITTVDVQAPRDAELARFHVTAQGDLILAGELRTIAVESVVTQNAARRFTIEARKTLRLSDFGIVPPSAFFGAIRVDDLVALEFRLQFGIEPSMPSPR